MLRSIAQTDEDLAAVFSRWYRGTTEHRMLYESAYTKITANSGVDQGCPLSAFGFSVVVDPTLHSIMTELCNLYDPGAQLFAYLDDWHPIPLEFQDKVTLTLSCLGGHLQIHGDTEPSPVVLGEQATMQKTTQRFQKIATTLADLNAEGLNVQTERSAHHVCWCCKPTCSSYELCT